MKLLGTVCFGFAIAFLVGAISVEAEEISDFRAEYDIARDGSVVVTETIAYDFASEVRHGIYRTLLTKHPQPATVWYKKRSVHIEPLTVMRNGSPEPFTVSRTSEEVEIKIGSASVTLTGLQIYTLTYELEGALSYGPSGTEFYWNVTGNDWSVSIMSATAVVRDASGDLFASASDCYVGVEGSVERCIKNTNGERQVLFSATSLQPGQQLTIAQELRTDAVAYVVQERLMLPSVMYVVPVMWLIGLAWYMYRYRTKYKLEQPIVAQYEPYQGLLPMYIGVLVDGRLDSRDVAAGILYLAEQGFIKIRKTESKVLWLFNATDYEITVLRSDTGQLPSLLQKILTILFRTGVTGLVGAPRSNGPGGVYTVGHVVTLSALKQNQSYIGQILTDMRHMALGDLKRDGFIFGDLTPQAFMQYGDKKILGYGVLLLTAFALVYAVHQPLTIIVGFMSMLIVAFSLPNRRTVKGYEALNHIAGFKLFLSVTDAERFAFHNAPEKNPELFM